MLEGAAAVAIKPNPGTTTKSAADLLRREFDPISWLVPGLLPEGLMVLAARPKIGKSWLALDVALATATGGEVLGRPARRGDVLYLALEDNDRRMQSRLLKLGAAGMDLQRFEYACSWPRGEFGAVAIEDWISARPDARLVVIDVLTKLREATTGRDNAYSTDYQAIAMLKPSRPGVTVLVVHHTRKAESDDPLDSVSGTLGIGGAADGVLVLKRARGESEAELHLIGRDLEDEGQFAVRFDRDSCRWQWMGEAWVVRLTAERRQALELLSAQPMKPSDLAKTLGKSLEASRVLIHRMAEDGIIDRGMDGRYRPVAPEGAFK